MTRPGSAARRYGKVLMTWRLSTTATVRLILTNLSTKPVRSNASGNRFAPLRSRLSSRHGAAPRETISASAGQRRLELPGVVTGGPGSLRRTPDACYSTAGAMSPAHRVVHDSGARADPGRP